MNTYDFSHPAYLLCLLSAAAAVLLPTTFKLNASCHKLSTKHNNPTVESAELFCAQVSTQPQQHEEEERGKKGVYI